MATLYVVATPIGNLEDLTRRAERVLREAPRVAAEDTRRTGVLLRHLGIATRPVSLHAHNEAARTETVLGWLDAGEDVALVSDAGTPLVSDPGGRVVSAAAAAGHVVVPVPGPSASLTALVASGLPADRFTFLGFLPRKGRAREALLERVASSEETCILFESPERLAVLLAALEKRCGGERRVAVARELTKVYEEVRRGTVAELHSYYSQEPARGEVTVVVEAAPAGVPDVDPARIRARADALLAGGATPSAAARELARTAGIGRNEAYRIVQEAKEEGS
ncbi:MAG: 16S rRNA (cytidine(1402)-2'-O)-methyltransferase [Longimicrobiales bacterium]|nr:16S rRNA (cytidine(1402)-2'-O)-methyltransferase [Longimicrobiales bacterium]